MANFPEFQSNTAHIASCSVGLNMKFIFCKQNGSILGGKIIYREIQLLVRQVFERLQVGKTPCSDLLLKIQNPFFPGIILTCISLRPSSFD